MIKKLLSMLSQISKPSLIKNPEFQAKVNFVKDNHHHIQSLYAELRSDLDKQLEKGEISSIDLKESKHREEFEFPNGWYSRLYQRSNGFDVMGVRCLKGSDFPEHHYPKQCVQIFVLSGSIHVSIKDFGSAILESGEHIKIRDKQPHSIRPIEDSFLLLISLSSIQ